MSRAVPKQARGVLCLQRPIRGIVGFRVGYWLRASVQHPHSKFRKEREI